MTRSPAAASRMPPHLFTVTHSTKGASGVVGQFVFASTSRGSCRRSCIIEMGAIARFLSQGIDSHVALGRGEKVPLHPVLDGALIISSQAQMPANRHSGLPASSSTQTAAKSSGSNCGSEDSSQKKRPGMSIVSWDSMGGKANPYPNKIILSNDFAMRLRLL